MTTTAPPTTEASCKPVVLSSAIPPLSLSPSSPPPSPSLFLLTCTLFGWSCLGVTVRLLLSALVKAGSLEADDVLYGELYPNMLGSFVLGTFTKTSPATLWAGVGVSSAFCGSLTTFSSWNVYAMLLLDRGEKALYPMALVVSFGMSYCAYLVGRSMPASSARLQGGVLCLAAVVAGAFAYHANESWEVMGWALCFAPLGASLRYTLGKWRPLWGTFVANICGTLVLAILTRWAGSSALVIGLGAGFCGSLTTVSSFIKELHTTRTASRARVYATVTLGAAQLVCALILLP